MVSHHSSYLPGLNVSDQPLPAGPGEGAAGEAVVGVMLAVGEAMLLCIALQHSLLILDGVRFPLKLVVPGETLVEGGDGLLFRLPVLHGSILSG